MSSRIAIFFWRTNATGPPAGVSPAASGCEALVGHRGFDRIRTG
jgi:hypothetical protein